MAVRGAVFITFLRVPKDSARLKRTGRGVATAATARLPNVIGLIDRLPKLRDRFRVTAGPASSVLVDPPAARLHAVTVLAAGGSANDEEPAASGACRGGVLVPGLPSSAAGVAPAFRRRPVKLNRRVSIHWYFRARPVSRSRCKQRTMNTYIPGAMHTRVAEPRETHYRLPSP